MVDNKAISLEFTTNEIKPQQELDGKITINYSGRFDSVSINSQIENSSDVFTYMELDGKKINHPYSRLSIFKKEMRDPRLIRFRIITNHIPSGESNVKFRVTLIQEHKEIEHDIQFIKIKK